MTTHRLRLPLAHPFTISRGTIHWQHSLLVELDDGRHRGWGEVTEDDFYGHTFASIEQSLRGLEAELPRYDDAPPEEVWDAMLEASGQDRFALSALDMAAHDLWGKRCGQPSWQRWGLAWEDVPASSFTIGLDSMERMVAKLREQPGWDIYKIKLGTGNDLEIVAALRRESEALFRVDANCAWTARQTIELAPRLAELGVEFIEQPLPHDAPPADQQRVFAESVLPVIADESCQVPNDVARCQGYFHGINVKLCKCGGLTPAARMLREARQRGMRTMVGCMVETAIGISGSSQLLPLLDYADLDGQVLLADSPTTGISVTGGSVARPQRPGNGGIWLPERAAEFLV
jgi:L-alanine-DL-glutamate epimerase-like enolase superfamily enzyme